MTNCIIVMGRLQMSDLRWRWSMPRKGKPENERNSMGTKIARRIGHAGTQHAHNISTIRLQGTPLANSGVLAEHSQGSSMSST